MNTLKKWLIGTLVAGAIIAGSIIPTKQKEEPQKREPIVIEKTINFENPQRTLNESLERLKPENISEIVYDPDFTHSDNYIKNRFVGHSRRLIEGYLDQARIGTEGHVLCVTGIFDDTGNNKKRTVFARKSLLNSQGINCEADLDSALYHENIHAGEERYGYDFGERIIKGEELVSLFKDKKIRTELIALAGEFDAYSSQIERAGKVEIKPSAIHILNATLNAHQTYSILERSISKEILTPLEIRYTETKMTRHKETIETLKRMR